MRRYFFVAAFLLLSASVFAQPVSADLGFSNNRLTTYAGTSLNANAIPNGQVIRVKVLVNNFDASGTAPAGHFRIRIGLGSGLVLNPGFNLATAALSDKFTWSYDLSGAQPQIVGNSIAPLAPDYYGTADFEVKANTEVTSTVSFNFLISNPQGTTTPLSDPFPSNNTGSNTYTVTAAAPLPVSFTGINATRNACDINVLWRVENQVNLKKYEVEISKDNSSFTKVGEVAVKDDPAYAFTFGLTKEVKASLLYIRTKSVDLDGSFRYSKTITVPGNCDAKWTLALFPNPVKDASIVTVMAREGIFDGTYKVSIISGNGQLIQQRDLKLIGVKSFPLSLQYMGSGKYHVSIQGAEDAAATVLDFEKL